MENNLQNNLSKSPWLVPGSKTALPSYPLSRLPPNASEWLDLYSFINLTSSSKAYAKWGKSIWNILFVHQNKQYLNNHPERPFPLNTKVVYLQLKNLHCTLENIEGDNWKNHNLIFGAPEIGSVHLVDLVIKHDPSKIHKKDYRGLTPLALAVAQGHVHVVDILLKHEVSIDENYVFEGYKYDNCSVLTMAARKRYTSIEKALLAAKDKKQKLE